MFGHHLQLYDLWKPGTTGEPHEQLSAENRCVQLVNGAVCQLQRRLQYGSPWSVGRACFLAGSTHIRTTEQGGQPSNCLLNPACPSWQEEESTAGKIQSSGKGNAQNRKMLERQSVTPLEF